MILLIDNYDSFTYNLYQLIEELGFRCQVLRNDARSASEIRRMKPARIVISPGPGDPDSAGISLELIREAHRDTPILGVCLGHQAIARAFGGRVVRAPKMMHGKISEVLHDGRGIFEGVDSPLSATRYHSLMVEKETLPPCLLITARTSDGVIMGIRHRKFPTEGIQFHPESVMTRNGRELVSNFLKRPGPRRSATS